MLHTQRRPRYFQGTQVIRIERQWGEGMGPKSSILVAFHQDSGSRQRTPDWPHLGCTQPLMGKEVTLSVIITVGLYKLQLQCWYLKRGKWILGRVMAVAIVMFGLITKTVWRATNLSLLKRREACKFRKQVEEVMKENSLSLEPKIVTITLFPLAAERRLFPPQSLGAGL